MWHSSVKKQPQQWQTQKCTYYDNFEFNRACKTHIFYLEMVSAAGMAIPLVVHASDCSQTEGYAHFWQCCRHEYTRIQTRARIHKHKETYNTGPHILFICARNLDRFDCFPE